MTRWFRLKLQAPRLAISSHWDIISPRHWLILFDDDTLILFGSYLYCQFGPLPLFIIISLTKHASYLPA